MPLHGGILVNTRRMSRILDINAEEARVQAGVTFALAPKLALRKKKFGDQVLLHAEFSKALGKVRPGALSIVRYGSRDQLREIIEFCESIGIRVANPHNHFLDDDVRWAGEHLLSAKHRWDPNGLLNPGHLRALEPAPAAAAGS